MGIFKYIVHISMDEIWNILFKKWIQYFSVDRGINQKKKEWETASMCVARSFFNWSIGMIARLFRAYKALIPSI